MISSCESLNYHIQIESQVYVLKYTVIQGVDIQGPITDIV